LTISIAPPFFPFDNERIKPVEQDLIIAAKSGAWY